MDQPIGIDGGIVALWHNEPTRKLPGGRELDYRTQAAALG